MFENLFKLLDWKCKPKKGVKNDNVNNSSEAAKIARDEGIQKAIDSANREVKNWSDVAYGYLLGYIRNHNEFMIEDIRVSSEGLVPEPPSKRAWGGIAVKAAKNGFIKRKGFQSVKNVKAHKTPATLWEVVNIKTI